MAARDDRWGGGGPGGGAATRPLDAAGATLGFALGGFFDGILLHQILQWHHLLSGLDGPRWRSLPVQVMADGLFHALMYVIALAGLWMLWKGRRAAALVSSQRFLGLFLAGFGLWHVADGVLFHWLLGLHHVRMNAASVLLWDLLFLVAGALLLVGGLALARVGRSTGGRSNGGRRAGGNKSSPSNSAGRSMFLLAALVCLAGAWAMKPAPNRLVTAVFPASAGPGKAVQAAARLEGRLVWLHPDGVVAVLALPGWGQGWAQGWRLYGAGALFVSGALSPPGCFAWARPVLPAHGPKNEWEVQEG